MKVFFGWIWVSFTSKSLPIDVISYIRFGDLTTDIMLNRRGYLPPVSYHVVYENIFIYTKNTAELRLQPFFSSTKRWHVTWNHKHKMGNYYMHLIKSFVVLVSLNQPLIPSPVSLNHISTTLSFNFSNI